MSIHSKPTNIGTSTLQLIAQIAELTWRVPLKASGHPRKENPPLLLLRASTTLRASQSLGAMLFEECAIQCDKFFTKHQKYNQLPSSRRMYDVGTHSNQSRCCVKETNVCISQRQFVKLIEDRH
eukprot:gb/GECG01003260.1/.p1 GENE.gb/GECG01003260.1/~~gb/GECG01003260.1/.p1  ORF type:complete len:124 (+),score=6.57 gb/GECG01003260.1/:1-372(+)